MLRLLLAVAIVPAVYYYNSGSQFYVSLLCGPMLYILMGGWSRLILIKKTMKRDIMFLKASVFAFIRGISYIKKKASFADVFIDTVNRHPNKVAFVSADIDVSLTFREAEQVSYKIANIFHDAGFRKGDSIALLMENRIEYIPIWLGLSMIGVITSLLNINLRGEALKHCISVCGCKGIIYTVETAPSLEAVVDDMEITRYCFDQAQVNKDVVSLFALLSGPPVYTPPEVNDVSLTDKLLYMYTSGTTGFQKAAVQRGAKCLLFSLAVNESLGVDQRDVIYSALPLYHSNACLIMGCQVLVNGATMVIKKRFSASCYMEDCRKFNATIINYIGETCRYLLRQPENILDSQNKIRMAVGNGLRSSIWDGFKGRFGIGLIVELYGSTEGNVGIMNVTGQKGAVGFNLVLFPNLLPIRLIKVDEESGEVVRGEDGLAQMVETGEPGQIVGKIRNDNIFQFDGYLNKSETQKKIARDVFSKGDSVYLSGDILTQDEEGYYYFHDRTGDTFRWKGENVSTMEVEGVISKALQLADVCVYSTEIPGHEGKAGMACICDPDRNVDVELLNRELAQALPRYSRPIFLRLTGKLDLTDTYKFRKNELRREGFNLAVMTSEDKVFYLDNTEKTYRNLDLDVYEKILNFELRF